MKPNAVHRVNLGMERYKCGSSLIVTCRASQSPYKRQVIIQLRHMKKHKPYYDVSMPAEAASMIRESIEWQTPTSMVPKIQALFLAVTAQQVHAAWARMSETLWKRDANQLESVKLLLAENREDVDVFEVEVETGVEQVCWGMKEIVSQLKGKVVERVST
jgi:hypothetical protein